MFAFIKHQSHNCKVTLFFFLFFFFVGWFPAYSEHESRGESLREHVRFLASDSLQGRGLGTEGNYIARQYIIEQFQQAGIRPFGDSYLQEFETRIGLAWVKASNVVGVIEGQDPALRNEYILIGAHYDHLGYEKKNGQKVVFPGADDNASGVAGIIETAKILTSGSGLQGRSIIVVAFDAEESGLLGAKHFIDNSPVEKEQIKLVFSLDMIGMYEANNGLILKGMGTLEGGMEVAAAVAASRQLTLKRNNARIEPRTDSAPFADAGIPAVHVFTGVKSPYHKPGDTYDLLDYDGMAMVVEYMKELLQAFSASPGLISSGSLLAHARQAQSSSKSRPHAGFIMHTGLGYHQYHEQFFRANSSFIAATGMFINIPAGKILALQPEVLYDINGSKIDGGNFRRHSVTVPVSIQIGTPKASHRSARAFIAAGPYYRYNLAGRSVHDNLDFTHVFARNEWGYQFGLGIQVYNFQIGYTLRKALTGIARDNDPGIFDTNNLLSIGFGF